MTQRPILSDARPFEQILRDGNLYYPSAPANLSLAGRDRDDFWPNLGMRVSLAGGFCPLVVMLAWGVPIGLMAVIQMLANGPRAGEVAGLIVAPVVGGLFLFSAGLIYTALVAMAALLVIGVTLRLLDESPPRDAVGAFSGSAVAYVSILPIWLYFDSIVASSEWYGAVVVWLHLTVALAMGQAAGLLAAVSEVRRRRRGRLDVVPFRLTLWRLMAGMIPLSLTLCLLRTTGLLTGPMALLSLAALATGWLLRKPIAWAVNRWLDRHGKLRRLARST